MVMKGYGLLEKARIEKIEFDGDVRLETVGRSKKQGESQGER